MFQICRKSVYITVFSIRFCLVYIILKIQKQLKISIFYSLSSAAIITQHHSQIFHSDMIHLVNNLSFMTFSSHFFPLSLLFVILDYTNYKMLEIIGLIIVTYNQSSSEDQPISIVNQFN